MGIRKPKLPVALLSAFLLSGRHGLPQRQAPGQLPAPQANAPAANAQPRPTVAADSKPVAGTANSSHGATQHRPIRSLDLIASAEKEYQAAEEKIQGRRYGSREADFDRAVDQLLQSPPEIRADERVQHELERVLEGLNRPELAALQSDTPAAAAERPSPRRSTKPTRSRPRSTLTSRPERKLKSKPRVPSCRLCLPIRWLPTSIIFPRPHGHDILQSALERGGRYREMIERTLREARRSARADLSGAGRVGFPSAGFVAGRSSRHVAVHVQPRPRLWIAA